MTPKQKAKELVDKFRNYVDSEIDGEQQFEYSKEQETNLSKKCALIVVNESLKNFDGLHKPEYCAFDAIGERKFTFKGEYDEHMTGYDMIEYWKEVKAEIEAIL